MYKITMLFFNSLFTLVLGLFFILILLKVICCRCSENKEEWLFSSLLFFKRKLLNFRNRAIQLTEISRDFLHVTHVPLVRNVYSDISEKVLAKKR